MKTSDHRGVAVHALGSEGGAAYGIVAGKLAISNSVKNLERMIDRVVDAPAKSGEPPAPAKKAFASLAGRAEWKTLKAQQDPDSLAWALADMDRLRKVDPKQYDSSKKPDNGMIVLFGSWYQAFQKAPWVSAGIRWSASELGATVELAVPKEGRPAAYKGYLPGSGRGAAALIHPPGTIASLSLWRNLETFWESRADLFPPETVQGFAQFDTLAGQFFGGREFGADVLGQFDPHWRLVVARSKTTRGLNLSLMSSIPHSPWSASSTRRTLISASGSRSPSRRSSASRMWTAIRRRPRPSSWVRKRSTASRWQQPATWSRAMADSANMVPSPRYNFTPATAQVGKYLIFSSSIGLARDLVKELKSKTAVAELGETAVLEADGSELARLLEINRSRLAMQLMLGRGETRGKGR